MKNYFCVKRISLIFMILFSIIFSKNVFGIYIQFMVP